MCREDFADLLLMRSIESFVRLPMRQRQRTCRIMRNLTRLATSRHECEALRLEKGNIDVEIHAVVTGLAKGMIESSSIGVFLGCLGSGISGLCFGMLICFVPNAAPVRVLMQVA